VRGGLGLLLQGLGDDSLNHRVGDCTRSARSRFVGQSIETVVEETLPPFADSDRVDVKSRGDSLVIQTLGAGQNDPGPGGQALNAFGPIGPGLKLLPLVIVQGEWGFRATALAHHISPLQDYMITQSIAQGYLANF
jgi:hypothetical protein